MIINILAICVCVLECILCLLWSTADAVSSGSCPILFKVLMLNVAICIVRLHFNHFSLSSVADFSNTEARVSISAGCVQIDAVWTGGLGVGHGNLSMAVFILTYKSYPYRWATVVPQSIYLILAVNHSIHTPKTWLGIVLSRQRVYLLAFMSTMLLPKAFEKKIFFFSFFFFLPLLPLFLPPSVMIKL